MGLIQWLKERRELKNWQRYHEITYANLLLKEQQTANKAAKVNLKLQKLQLKVLTQEEERLRRKPKYIE